MDDAKFWATLRVKLGSNTQRRRFTAEQVEGVKAILAACKGWPISWTAYALATAWHETAFTMQPVKERGGSAYLTRMYDVTGARPALARKYGNTTPGDGVRYCGRGYVQLTWRAGYAKAGKALGVPLEAEPDMALLPDIAAQIMRKGMEQGWFTGMTLAKALPRKLGTYAQFMTARKIINGTDKAATIAVYAIAFQDALFDGGWTGE